MKKIGIIFLFIILVLLSAALIFPLILKGPLVKKVKETINEQIDARVEFTNLQLSLFRNFPRIRAGMEGLTVTGKDRFRQDTLLYLGSVTTRLSLGELIRGDIQINSLTVRDARIRLLCTHDGQNNWDIFPGGDSKKNDTETEGGSTEATLPVDLKNLDVENLNLEYSDEATATRIRLLHTSLQAAGKLEGTVSRLKLEGTVGELLFSYDSVQYLGNTMLKIKSELEADYDKMAFVLGESTLFLNNLPLDLSGTFSLPSDSLFINLQFRQPGSNFAALLDMVPQRLLPYLKKVKTTGKAGFEGEIKGLLYNDQSPELNIRLFVRDATFGYEDSQEMIEQIKLEGQVYKPQGKLDLLELNITEAGARIRENPVSLSMKLTHPVSDPEFAVSFKGKLDFSSLTQVIVTDSLQLSGLMEGKLEARGTMSAMEQEEYEQVKVSGKFIFKGFSVKTPGLTRPVEVSSGQLHLDNTEIRLSAFKGKTGQSDFLLNGRLSDYLPYLLLNKTLKGNLDLKSNYLNFDELATITAAEDSTVHAQADSLIAFRIPDNMNLVFRAQIDRASLYRMNIRDMEGQITVHNQMLQLDRLNMNMLDGQLTLNGLYKSNPENRPEFDFKADVRGFQIPAAYRSFGVIQRYLPIAARSEGTVSSQVNFKGQFDEQLNIIPSSLNGNGLMNTQNLRIVNSAVLDQLKGVIRSEKLRDLKIEDFTANFNMENGNINLTPFITRIADQEVNISGALSVEQMLDLVMDFRISKADLSEDINKALDFLPGSENISLIEAAVRVKGELKNPGVSVDLSKARKQIEQEVRRSTRESLEKSVKKVGDELKKLFQ
ncbi:MAG: AsmA-like C-terminal region-containing protein [Mangrovibacterium sp.]